MSSIMDILRFPFVEDSADEPTTSFSSDASECPSDGNTPTSEGIDYLAQLLTNSTQQCCTRKRRSLAETVEILKRKKEAQVERSSSIEPVPPPLPSPPPSPTVVPFILPIFGPNGQAAAERLASMVVKEKEQQAAAVISFEKEKEVKNQIKQMTSTLEAPPISQDDDKRFGCQICNKKFANKFLLNKHIFIHTGLRPHQCPDCHKSFNRKDNLLRHRKTHQIIVREDRGLVGNAVTLVTGERSELSSNSPENLIMTLFAAHQQQQQQHV